MGNGPTDNSKKKKQVDRAKKKNKSDRKARKRNQKNKKAGKGKRAKKNKKAGKNRRAKEKKTGKSKDKKKKPVRNKKKRKKNRKYAGNKKAGKRKRKGTNKNGKASKGKNKAKDKNNGNGKKRKGKKKKNGSKRRAQENKSSKKQNKSKQKGKRNRKSKKKGDRKKIKALKKLKKMKQRNKKKGKKKKNRQGQQRQTNCQNITCLNNLLQVLKINKDTVQNFIQQKKRMDSRLTLAGNKGNKSSKTNASLTLLANSLGGTKSLTKSAPICAGRYNESKAIEGMKVFQNMSKCDRLVSEACDIKLSTNESSDVAKCNKVMGEFRENADACIKTPTNCSCWNSLVKDVKSVKDCNIAGAKEKDIKKKLTLCKNVFGACKDYEDKSIVYIATCKTSSNALKTILLALYQSKEKLTKVQAKNAKIANSTASSSRAIVISSVELVTKITTFTTMSSSVDVDQIGSNATLKSLAKTISSTYVANLTFTAAQISSSMTISVSLTTILLKVESRITEVKTMLSDLTGTTINPSEIVFDTFATEKPDAGNLKGGAFGGSTGFTRGGFGGARGM